MTTPLKFRTIVIATDLTENTSNALKHAQAIARQHGSKLVVMHVIDPLGYAFPHGASTAIASDPSARTEMALIEIELIRQGIAVHSVVESGSICERILQAVRDHQADLLVIGTKAGSNAGRLALGTVARQLLAKAPCPVLTVPADAKPVPYSAGSWRHVLVATDFSPASLAAIGLAQRITHSRLLALHASSRCQAKACSRCLERLRFLAPFNESHTLPVDHVVTEGEAAQAIAESARQFHADLIVLGSPENELTENDLPTSTVLRVISNVGCPVLCVPTPTPTRPGEMKEEAVSCSKI
jgi:nucleotide-binding universal stress UspA family protein